MSPTSNLRTDRLFLFTPKVGDENRVFEILSNPETNQHNPSGPMKDLVQAQERVSHWINDWSVHGIGYWCIRTLDDPNIIGVSGVRITEWSNRQVLNLYYRFTPVVWGKGYATEVAKEAIKVANHHFPTLPVIIRTRPTNISSIRVAERLGLTRRADLDTAEHIVYTSIW